MAAMELTAFGGESSTDPDEEPGFVFGGQAAAGAPPASSSGNGSTLPGRNPWADAAGEQSRSSEARDWSPKP